MEPWPAAQRRGEEGSPVVGSGVRPPPAPHGPKPWPRHLPAGRGAFRSHLAAGEPGAPPALLRLRRGGCACGARGTGGDALQPPARAAGGAVALRGAGPARPPSGAGLRRVLGATGRRGDGLGGGRAGGRRGRGRRDGQPVRPQEAEPRHGAGQGRPGEAGARAGPAGEGPRGAVAGPRVHARGAAPLAGPRAPGGDAGGAVGEAWPAPAGPSLRCGGRRPPPALGRQRVPGTSCPRRDLLPGPPVAMETAMRSRFRGARGGSVSVGRGDVGPAARAFPSFLPQRRGFVPREVTPVTRFFARGFRNREFQAVLPGSPAVPGAAVAGGRAAAPGQRGRPRPSPPAAGLLRAARLLPGVASCGPRGPWPLHTLAHVPGVSLGWERGNRPLRPLCTAPPLGGHRREGGGRSWEERAPFMVGVPTGPQAGRAGCRARPQSHRGGRPSAGAGACTGRLPAVRSLETRPPDAGAGRCPQDAGAPWRWPREGPLQAHSDRPPWAARGPSGLPRSRVVHSDA